MNQDKTRFSPSGNQYPKAAKHFESARKYKAWKVENIEILRSTYDDQGEELLYECKTTLSGCFGFSFMKRIVRASRIKFVSRSYCDQIENQLITSNSINLSQKLDSTAIAAETLRKALIQDQGLRETYIANIAICIVDEFEQGDGKDLVQKANLAAESFINLFCS